GAAVMQFGVMAPLSAASAVVMFIILVYQLHSLHAAALLALLYAFATPVFLRSGQLNHNLLVAHCALFAFALLWRPWQTPRRPAYAHDLLAGLLAGWAVVLDYSGLIVPLTLGLYVIAREPLERRASTAQSVTLFGTGVLVSLTVLWAYQWSAF